MVRSLAFSNDGATLVAVEGKQVRLWDVESGELRDTFQQPDNGSCASFSPDGKTLAVGSLNYKIRHEGGREIRESLDGTILLWDPSTGEQRDSLSVHSGRYIYSVAFSPDGQTLASAGEDGRVCFSDPQNGTLRRSLTLGPSGGRIFRLVYSPDGQYLASVNGNGTISIIQASDPNGTDIFVSLFQKLA